MRAFIMILLMLTFMNNSIVQAEKKIMINLASRTLSLYENNQRIALYLLGVGKISTPTPVGYYKILTKEIDPPWIDPSNPEYEVPSGADNPLGYRWMQIHGNYGIHGTNKPSSIGHYVSNGCIRMWEKDVEALFDEVEVGTPVEITYNRVVVEKAADDQIAYYIYPDGYSRQALDVKYVNSWIEPWGVSAFAEDSEIADAISRSDGEPIYIGKAYNVQLEDEVVPATDQNKRHFDSKAVERGGITYLPAVPIAIALKMKLEWRHHTTLATNYGEVTGIEKKGQLYLNEDDAGILFKVEGWREGNTYKLKKLPEDETFNIKEPTNTDNPVNPPEDQTNIDKPENSTTPESISDDNNKDKDNTKDTKKDGKKDKKSDKNDKINTEEETESKGMKSDKTTSEKLPDNVQNNSLPKNAEPKV